MIRPTNGNSDAVEKRVVLDEPMLRSIAAVRKALESFTYTTEPDYWIEWPEIPVVHADPDNVIGHFVYQPEVEYWLFVMKPDVLRAYSEYYWEEHGIS